MKASAKALIRAASDFLGIPYSTLDCQAFVEKCLREIGIIINLAGSNAWYREVMAHGWVGTPEECRKKYGEVPAGAFLFILEQNGKEPEKYHGDGIGNASHIGIYTGETAEEMLQDCRTYHELEEDPDAQKAFVKEVSHGNGAIHSSKSRGCVATSKFSGKTISGGWNRVGLWDRIEYESGWESMEPYQARVIGGALNLRKKPNKNADRIYQIPEGEIVTVTAELDDGWSFVEYHNMTGYVVSAYLQPVSDGERVPDKDMVSVPRSEIEAMYAKLGEWLRG